MECKDVLSFSLHKGFQMARLSGKSLCTAQHFSWGRGNTWDLIWRPHSHFQKEKYKLLRRTKISQSLLKLELNLRPFTSATVFWMWEKHVGICFSTDYLLYYINGMGQRTYRSAQDDHVSLPTQGPRLNIKGCNIYVWGVGSIDENKRHLSRRLFTDKLLFLGVTIFVLQFTYHSRLPKIPLE